MVNKNKGKQEHLGWLGNICVFIPSEINKVLVKREALRGEYLIGVSWHKKGKAFIAMVNKNKGKQEHLGCFKTEIEAFNAYKQAKESFIKEQAEKWKGKIDDRAYEALMNYEVEITDETYRDWETDRKSVV